MSSVATNTSRVSPTLCHILGGGGRAAAAGRAARPGLQRRAPGAAGPRAGMGGGRPSAAPPGGGAGRRGGGRGCRPDRPSVSPRPAGRGLARVSLRPHRSGEPRTRRPETPAAAGCAPMADAARSWIGETASTGPRGGHPALVATRPRVPQPPKTVEVNVSQLRRGCLSAPSPLPLRQLITERPHHSPPPRAGRLGDGVQRQVETWGSRPAGTTTPRMQWQFSCFASPFPAPPPPLIFLNPQALSGWCSRNPRSCLLLGAVPMRQSDFHLTSHGKSFRLKSWSTKHEEGRKGRQLTEKLVACKPSPFAVGKGWINGTFEEYPRPCQRDGLEAGKLPFSPVTDVVLCFHG